MVNEVAPDDWYRLKMDLCKALNAEKIPRTLEILATTYKHTDVLCLQEVAPSFIEATTTGKLGECNHVLFPQKLGKSNQNSIILLNKGFFSGEFTEVTAEVEACVSNRKWGDGDLFAICTEDDDGQQYIIVSFHGDTNGNATPPVIQAVHEFASLAINQDKKLVFGLDANVYEKEKKGLVTISKFAEVIGDIKMSSCWGDEPAPDNYTTFNARTYLQPQLNKAIRFEDKAKNGDINPKDHIIFYKNQFACTTVRKDNTGTGTYLEDTVFPTLSFPSDHGIVYSVLQEPATASL